MILKVAFYSFGGCEGCSYELLNLDEALLEALEEMKIEIAHSIIFGVPEEEEAYDISFVEGSVASKEDIEKLREIRGKSKILVAMGSCAALGGIPGLRRFAEEREVKRVYGGVRLEHEPLSEAAPLSKFVKVDYELKGCPINKNEFLDLLRKISRSEWFLQEERRFSFSREKTFSIDGAAVTLDGEKCIVCGRCVKVCESITSAIDYANRSVDTIISTPFKVEFDESQCISCGQCTLYCPVSALREKSSVKQVRRLLESGTDLSAYVEPEVIAAITETLNIDGSGEGKIVAALKKLGFRNVILWKPKVQPRKNGGLIVIPESEAEARFIQLFYPDLQGYVTDPPRIEDENAVWITPCLARKLGDNLVLTTRELIRLLGTFNLNLLPASSFDDISIPEKDKYEIVATGMEEVRKVLEEIRSKKLNSGTVRLYVCQGGCLQGGGQPFSKPSRNSTSSIH